MGNDFTFRILVLLLFASFVAYRGYCTRKFGRPAEDTLKQIEGNRAAQIANLLSLLGLLSVFLYIVYPAWIAWAALPLPYWLRWSGIAFAILGFVLLQWAHQALDKNWSDTPRLLKDQTLVTGGPYHWIRHPIYTGFLLIMGATLFLSANGLIGLLWIGATALDVLARIAYEEGLMIEIFGDRYRDYMRQTGRLLPRIVRQREAGQVGR